MASRTHGTTASVTPSPEVVKQLRAFFQRNGYVRRLDPARRANDGQSYKKGDEVRLVADSKAELDQIRRLLARAGFSVARPFSHSRQWRQPIYGVTAVARFLTMVGGQQKSQREAEVTQCGHRSSRP
jgi:hypothetical protein